MISDEGIAQIRSLIESILDERGVYKKAPVVRKRKEKTKLPEGFAISERVQAWADKKQYGDLPKHFNHFVRYCSASGTRYMDWDQAFMNAVQDDWARLRRHPTGVWWSSNEGIQTKAAELGITPRGGESWMDLKARVTKQLESVAPF